MVVEDITIRIRAIDEASRVLSRVAGSVKQISAVAPQLSKGVDKLTIVRTFKPVAASANLLSGQMANLGISAQSAGLSVKTFNKTIKGMGINFVQGMGFIDKFTGKLMDTAKVTRMVSVQAKRFKMEWLSVMFAGMAISRVFGGLVRTQLELFGVTDTLSAMWTTVLLPIMELITPFLFSMLEFFMNMPDSVKLVTGALIIFTAILGLILTVVGQVMLAIGGFSILGVTLSGVISFLGIFAAILIGIILIVKGIYDIFKRKFEGIGQIIMGIGVILLLFIGWWALIPIAVGAVVYLVIKYWDKVKSFFIRVWGIIKKTFSKAWDFIKAMFLKLTVVNIIIKNWDMIKNFFGRVWKSIKKTFSKAWDFIKAIFFKATVVGIIIKNWEKVKKFFSGLWGGLKRGFVKVWESIKSTSKGAINVLISGMNFWIRGLENMINIAINGLNKLIRLMNKVPGVDIRKIGDVDLGRIPSFQTGGIVPETGPALLHKGEMVIPRSEVNRGAGKTIIFNNTFNLDNKVSSDVDIDRLAEEINRKLAPQFERAVGRGTI